MMTNHVEMPHHNGPYSPNIDVLHTKPICSRMIKTLQHLYVDSTRAQFNQSWKRNVFALAAASAAFTSYALIALASLVESVASLVLCLAAAVVQVYLTTDDQKLKDISIQLLAYSAQSICTLSIAALAIFTFHSKEWSRPKEHVCVTILDCATYLASAAIAQLLGSTLFHFLRQKQGSSSTSRVNQVIIQGTPPAFAAITQSIPRDYAVVGADRLREPENFARDYLSNNPPSQRDLMKDFSLVGFIVDHTLRPLSDLLEQYSDQVQLIEESAIASREGDVVILNSYQPPDQDYHNFLKTCVKSAVKKMITNRYARWLNREDNLEKGKNCICCYGPDAVIPIANLAQFEELERTIICPLTFTTEELVQYNNPSRRRKLEELKNLVRSLSANDKELLIERLIKTSDFQLGDRSCDHEESVSALYIEISHLAASLHQGQLLTLPTLNTDNLDAGGINYFGVSWGEAVSEIEQ